MRNSKRMLTLLLVFAILIVMSVCAGALKLSELKDSIGITIDGYANEPIWESSPGGYFKVASGGGGAIRILADKHYIYIHAFANDYTESETDTFTLSVSGIGGTHAIKINRMGAKLSGSGTYAVHLHAENEFSAEFKFPTSITKAGNITAKLIASDNGVTSSGQVTLSITAPTTTTTTTTKTPTQPPTQAPNTPNTKLPAGNSGTPSSGGSSGDNSTGSNSSGGNTGSNNNLGGSVTLTPPAGGTTAPGETTAAPRITDKTVGAGMTDTSGETITTPEGETITLPPDEQGQGGNRALLVSSAVIIAGLIILFAWFALKYYYGSKKNDEEEEDNYVENDVPEQEIDAEDNPKNEDDNADKN